MSPSKTYGRPVPLMLPDAVTDKMTKIPFVYTEHRTYVVTIPFAYLESDAGIIYRCVTVTRVLHLPLSLWISLIIRCSSGSVYTGGHGPNTKLADFFTGIQEAPPSRRFDRLAAIVQQVCLLHQRASVTNERAVRNTHIPQSCLNVFLTAQTSGNYYHFVCECLSRLLLLEPYLLADPTLRLLTPASEPFMRELLEMLGVASERIVPYKCVKLIGLFDH